ncbi:MAG TPA: UDP-glucose 4-epimerase GalE [Gammaproteobacteria bacterium]
MAKILVTGGAGYVGSHACKALALSGHESVVFDNLSRGHTEFVKWGPLEEGDLLDADRLREVLKRHLPDAVMHFAALAYVGESVADPGRYYRNNVLGSLTLIEQMIMSGTTRLVFSSTCAVYGLPLKMPITETTPTNPINPYGRTKLAVERMLEDFDTSSGLRSVSLRYFNAAGADPDGEIGERHEPETHAIPRAIQSALGEGDIFEVFGTDYDTPDGTAVRDYIHVEDLARAHVRAIEYLLQGGETAAANLGTGRGTSVKEIIDAVARVSGRSPKVRNADRRPGDPPVLVADAARAGDLFGWAPEYTDIDDIVSTAVEWHRLETAR